MKILKSGVAIVASLLVLVCVCCHEGAETQAEGLLLAGKYEEAGAYLDWNSFFLRYLVDEVVLNQDSGVTSMYFYKDAEDDLLYSGPIWDYDASLGAGSLTSMMNYHVIAGRDLNSCRGDISLSWYSAMYDSVWFQAHIRELYRETVRPYLETLLKEKIDDYIAEMKRSRELDGIRWRNLDCKTGHYTETENELRYLKYFLEQRVSSLDEEWLGEKTEVNGQSDGTVHTVRYVSEKGMKLEEVKKEKLSMAISGGSWYNHPSLQKEKTGGRSHEKRTLSDCAAGCSPDAGSLRRKKAECCIYAGTGE